MVLRVRVDGLTVEAWVDDLVVPRLGTAGQPSLHSSLALIQCSPLSLVEVQRGSALIGRELQRVAFSQQSYAIKNQLVATKAH